MTRWQLRPLIVALLCSLITPAVWAQRVLLEQPLSSDQVLFEAFGRIRAELKLQSFEVVVVTSGAADLQQAMRAQGGIAAIALRRRGKHPAAEVLIVDRHSGAVSRRKLHLGDSKNGPTLLAVRATDLLRASLAELPREKRPVPTQAPASQAKRLPAPSRKTTTPELDDVEPGHPSPDSVFAEEPLTFEIRAGGVALATRDFGGALGPRLGVGFRPLPYLSLGVEYRGPMEGLRFETGDGVASFRQQFALLVARISLPIGGSQSKWTWGPALGLGAQHISATGVVQAPLIGKDDDTWGPVVDLGLGLLFSPMRSVGIGVELGGIALLRRPILAVAEVRSPPLSAEARLALDLTVGF